MMTEWTGDLYERLVFNFDKSSWRAEEILNVQVLDQFAPYEEKTVLRCTQISPSPGKTAIIKVHLQIPDASGRPLDGAVHASVKTEIECLKRLTQRGCSSTPRLIAYSQTPQPEKMGFPLPGGFLVCILMEFVPGKTVMDFWDYDRETRDRIRRAFKKSWQEVNKASVYHGDGGLRNILWDAKAGKCYILDFESADYDRELGPWCDAEYAIWDLVKAKGDVDVF